MVLVAALAAVLAARPAAAYCDGTVDIRDVDAISWAVVPSFGGEGYLELRRYGELSPSPTASAVRYAYHGYRKQPAVERADTSDALFQRAIAVLDAAHVLRLEPKSGPQRIRQADGTVKIVARLDGTTTFLGLKRCGVTLQLEASGDDEPRLTAIVRKLDALVESLPWSVASPTNAPPNAPVFRFPL